MRSTVLLALLLAGCGGSSYVVLVEQTDAGDPCAAVGPTCHSAFYDGGGDPNDTCGTAEGLVNGRPVNFCCCEVVP